MRAVTTQASRLNPTASIYWAVLNHTLMSGLCRTTVSTTAAVSPPIRIDHGWPKSGTEARKGMKATELLTFANEILSEEVSHAIPNRAKATTPFRSEEH